jgi:cytochrome P450
VEHDGAGTWTLLRHADVVAAALDPETFSSAAGSHRAIPNSLDGAEHAAYRAVVDRYLTASAVAAQEPQCRAHAAAIVDALPRRSTVDAIAEFGTPFAVRTQVTWLGWPAAIEDELVAWMADNFAATRPGDRARTAEVAARFDALVGGQVRVRREAGESAPRDVTTSLLHETVDGRALTDEEVVSILRNWTAGDLGSLAACLGVLVHRLATHPDRQEVTRDRVARGEHAAIEAAIEEVLRIDDPFVAGSTYRRARHPGWRPRTPQLDRGQPGPAGVRRPGRVPARGERPAEPGLRSRPPRVPRTGSHSHGAARRDHRAPRPHRAATPSG